MSRWLRFSYHFDLDRILRDRKADERRYVYEEIRYHHLTPDDPYYEKVIQFLCEDPEWAYELIAGFPGLVDKRNPYYEYVVKSVIKDPEQAECLLKSNMFGVGNPYYNLVKEAVEKNK